MLTKGKMVVLLKKHGVRKGDKNGAQVALEHLKYCDICKLYYSTFECK